VFAQEQLVAGDGRVCLGIVGFHVVGEGFRRNDETGVRGDFLLHEFDEACIQGTLRLDTVFAERVDVGLDDHHFHRVLRLPVAGVPDLGADDGHEDQQDGTQCAAALLPVSARTQGQEDGGVAEQDPGRAAQGTEDLIPLHEARRVEEGVTQAEPGPGQFYLEIDVLPGQPGEAEEEQRTGFGHQRALFVPPDHAAAPATDGKDPGHLQGVEQQRCHGTHGGDEPDPERGENVEQREGCIVVPEGMPDVQGAQGAVQHVERDKAHQRQESQVRNQEGQAHQHGKACDKHPQSAFGLMLLRFHHFCV